MIDRNNLLDDRARLSNCILELGCGTRKRYPGSIGIDMLDLPGVDLIGDALEIMKKFPSGVVRMIHAHHFLEHVTDLRAFADEFGRLLAVDGSAIITVPHFSNPYYYSDYTHRSPFGLYTFSYLSECDLFSRKVPTYGVSTGLRTVDVKLGFKSSRPFYVRHAIRRVFGAMVNMTRYTQEFYEESLCYLLPCYEITYFLQRK